MTGGTGEANACLTARLWTPCRTANARVDKPSRSRSLLVGEAFVSQHHEPGAEAEVDWGEAVAVIDGQQVKVHLFQLRLCHSGAAFASAFLRETQQAFLEAHADAFEFLDGVPGLVRYDNLTSAVKQVLRCRRRVETDRFIGLRSHYMFESQFTLVDLLEQLHA